ncbi:MAG TPA: hypothetical protein VFB12_14410, partial [Ktedonobacteraceae bacterium]|nr:hypothetical protein [Ktedonobacteraceae bacterium]
MHDGLTTLEAAISAIDFFDHEQIEWQRVQRTVYLLHQHLRYEYPGPIYDLDQRLMILPPDRHGNQRLLDYR